MNPALTPLEKAIGYVEMESNPMAAAACFICVLFGMIFYSRGFISRGLKRNQDHSRV